MDIKEEFCNCSSGGAKRKLSPYNKFVKKEFKEMKKKYPTKTAPEIMKMIAKKWKETKK